MIDVGLTKLGGGDPVMTPGLAVGIMILPGLVPGFVGLLHCGILQHVGSFGSGTI